MALASAGAAPYVSLYYSIVQRAASRYFKEYYRSGELFLLYEIPLGVCLHPKKGETPSRMVYRMGTRSAYGHRISALFIYLCIVKSSF